MDELLSSDATMSGAWLVTFVARITISKSHQPRSFQRCRHLEIPPPASPLDKQPFCASNPRFPGFQPKVAETRFRKLGEGVRESMEEAAISERAAAARYALRLDAKLDTGHRQRAMMQSKAQHWRQEEVTQQGVARASNATAMRRSV